MKQVTWSPRALSDLIGIGEFYDRLDPSMTDAIMDRIETAPLPLLDAPNIGSPRPDGTRKWRARGTPFLLFYDVIPSGIAIVTVRHERSAWRD